MNTKQATALLKQLEAEHGDRVLASLLGAAWRAEQVAFAEQEGLDPEEFVRESLFGYNGYSVREWLGDFEDSIDFTTAAGA